MRDRNNPLKNFPQHAFTVIQGSHTLFHKELADLPSRYKTGCITYINNHQYVPLLKIREEERNRYTHLQIDNLPELLMTIEIETSAVLIIEHHLSWFKPDCPNDLKSLNSVCRKRALHGSPVVYITVIMDRGLLELDGQADFFFQIGKVPLKGKALVIKEQVYLDQIPDSPPGVYEKVKMYGQTDRGKWWSGSIDPRKVVQIAETKAALWGLVE
jgi:hypothetical protein